MLAYADGKEVEWSFRDEKSWEETNFPAFNWGSKNYRIKPEPKYRPFKDAEECWQEMRKHRPFGWIRWKKEPRIYQSLVAVEKSGVGCVINEAPMGFRDGLDILTFADGEPFGVKEEA